MNARVAAAFAFGLAFGLGLVVAGMHDPAKVPSFLDVAGAWDPSLAFVLAGAIGTTWLGYRVVLRREAPALAPRFELPTVGRVDGALVGGSALFGLGWGLSGFCPGPAVASAALGAPGTYAFLGAMVAGLLLGGRAKAITGGRTGDGPGRTAGDAPRTGASA